jgi:hypothetical protein
VRRERTELLPTSSIAAGAAFLVAFLAGILRRDNIQLKHELSTETDRVFRALRLRQKRALKGKTDPNSSTRVGRCASTDELTPTSPKPFEDEKPYGVRINETSIHTNVHCSVFRLLMTNSSCQGQAQTQVGKPVPLCAPVQSAQTVGV